MRKNKQFVSLIAPAIHSHNPLLPDMNLEREPLIQEARVRHLVNSLRDTARQFATLSRYP